MNQVNKRKDGYLKQSTVSPVQWFSFWFVNAACAMVMVDRGNVQSATDGYPISRWNSPISSVYLFSNTGQSCYRIGPIYIYQTESSHKAHKKPFAVPKNLQIVRLWYVKPPQLYERVHEKTVGWQSHMMHSKGYNFSACVSWTPRTKYIPQANSRFQAHCNIWTPVLPNSLQFGEPPPKLTKVPRQSWIVRSTVSKYSYSSSFVPEQPVLVRKAFSHKLRIITVLRSLEIRSQPSYDHGGYPIPSWRISGAQKMIAFRLYSVFCIGQKSLHDCDNFVRAFRHIIPERIESRKYHSVYIVQFHTYSISTQMAIVMDTRNTLFEYEVLLDDMSKIYPTAMLGIRLGARSHNAPNKSSAVQPKH